MTELPLDVEATIEEISLEGGKVTAKKALEIFRQHKQFKGKILEELSNNFRNEIAAAFALEGKTLYGRAFDAVGHEEGGLQRDMKLEDLHPMVKSGKITIYEIKSTNRKLDAFKNFFFSITTAEILVAQSLGSKFKFVLVNTTTGEVESLTLHEVYARAEKIYPTWSIRFKK